MSPPSEWKLVVLLVLGVRSCCAVLRGSLLSVVDTDNGCNNRSGLDGRHGMGSYRQLTRTFVGCLTGAARSGFRVIP